MAVVFVVAVVFVAAAAAAVGGWDGRWRGVSHG